MGQGPSEKCIWKIFYRAVLENGHPEVHEVHDPLEVPYKVCRKAMFSLSPITVSAIQKPSKN